MLVRHSILLPELLQRTIDNLSETEKNISLDCDEQLSLERTIQLLAALDLQSSNSLQPISAKRNFPSPEEIKSGFPGYPKIDNSTVVVRSGSESQYLLGMH